MRHLPGQIARLMVRRLIALYYPKIEITGREHIPRSGPVLLAANHANSLIDPVIVGLAAQRPVCFFAKAPLFDTPVLGPVMRALGMIPAFRGQDDSAQVRRNLDSLAVGAEALQRGEAVGIFPEGKSHDATKLEQIRSGAARIAVQAVENGAHELKLVPVGINYQRKQQFRSSIWVRIGEPIHVGEFVAEHGNDLRKAMRALTAEIEGRLKQCVLHLEEPVFAPFLDELELLLPATRLAGYHRLPELHQRKRIGDAMNYFLAHDRARAEEMAGSIREYRSRLRAAQLNSRSAVMRYRGGRLLGVLAMRAVWLAFWFPAAAIGTAFHVVPFTVTRAIARRFEEGPTTTALWRLALGLPAYLVWYVGAAFALHAYFVAGFAWAILALMPLLGVQAISYCARAPEICHDWIQQVRALQRRPELLELRAEQDQVRAELQGFAEQYAQHVPAAAEPPRRITTRDRVKLIARWTAIGAVAAGLFVWQNWWFKDDAANDRVAGLNVAGMSPSSLSTALTGDETALAEILSGVDALERRSREVQAEFDAGQRSWYRQADNDAVRQLLLRYVNYRSALLRLAWKYQNHGEVSNEVLRLRSFLVSYTAATTLYAASLKFVTRFETAPNAIRKLNEPEPLWDIPAGLYDDVRRNVANAENRRLLRRATTQYRASLDAFARCGLTTSEPQQKFHRALADANRVADQLSPAVVRAGVVTPLADAQETGKTLAYRAQSFVSTWIGDARIREPRDGKALIEPAQVVQLRARLKPGDILLERRNWFLSNAFLPGYWPHSALYLGTAQDLQQLGVDRDPRVQKHWAEFTRRDDNGHERAVIESVSEGVVFTSLEHSVGEADAAAFLRPRLPPARLREAIARAFSHSGKPYDFEFDFFSTDKLVCTELVFRSYDGDIEFPLVTIMGTKTLPAIELVRKFSAERGQPGAQFDFVAFLDGDERAGRARFAGVDEFVGTLRRPALTWLQGLSKGR